MKARNPSSAARRGGPPYLVYEDTARYDLWLKLVLAAALAATLVGGVVMLPTEPAGAWSMLGVTVFDALLFYAVMPRKYQVLQDRVRIVLGGPFAFGIPLSTIKAARSGSRGLTRLGIGFATSFRHVVEIERNKGLSVFISPANPEMFLEQLSQAMNAAGRSR
ncbi:MAG: PH domain-containing protein [Chloroflexota bacterium]